MDFSIPALPRELGALHDLSDTEVVQEVTRRAAHERHATADLIRGLIELDRRRLYLSQGFPSLYAYCTEALHYSEYGAFNRIEVARAAARWPQLLTALENGWLHLSGARLLAPHLTEDNVDGAIESARHKSKRDIEVLAAELAQRSLVLPVDAVQYRLHLTISRTALDTLRQVQALMGHQRSKDADSLIFEQAIALLLKKLEQQRFAATDHPREASQEGSVGSATSSAEPPRTSGDGAEDPLAAGPRSRYIPAAVKRGVWKRDQGRCAFVGIQGRCNERRCLEFHHVVPFAVGGRSTTANIELRCRSHNSYEAEVYFGADAVAAARDRRQSSGSPAGARDPATAHPARPGTSPGAGDHAVPEGDVRRE